MTLPLHEKGRFRAIVRGCPTFSLVVRSSFRGTSRGLHAEESARRAGEGARASEAGVRGGSNEATQRATSALNPRSH